jgi:hypothetical protein
MAFARMTGLVLSLALLPAVMVSQPPKARADDAAAAIAGGIVGLAVGAALSKKHHHHNDIYYPGYAPPYGPGGYGPAWGQSFSPAPGAICYPIQRACYRADGSFAPVWTSRVFGY